MKKTITFLKIITIVAVIGFSMISCENGNNDTSGEDIFAGTWTNIGGEGGAPGLKFIAADGLYSQYMISGNIEVVRGIYSVSGNSVTIKINELNTVIYEGSDTWFNYETIPEPYKGYAGPQIRTVTINNNKFGCRWNVYIYKRILVKS